MRAWLLSSILVTACGAAATPVAPPPPPPPPPPATTVAPPPRGPAIVPLTRAVDDALSGPLTYLGTGPWHGISRIHACAYRNERVLVVDVYCTKREQRAFRVDVYSPQYGKVRIYAEAKSAISPLRRAQYFTFSAEAEPLVPGAAVALDMGFPALQEYETRRYQRSAPACFHNMDSLPQPRTGCLATLRGRASEWAEASGPFLQDPPESWYRLVTTLKGLAREHGKDVDRPSG